MLSGIAAPSKSTFIAIGLAVLGLGYGMHPPTAPAQAADASQRTVTVVGFGRVQTKPDSAVMRIAVTYAGATKEEAENGHNQARAALLSRLKALGVADDDVQQGQTTFARTVTDRLGLLAEGVARTLADGSIRLLDEGDDDVPIPAAPSVPPTAPAPAPIAPRPIAPNQPQPSFRDVANSVVTVTLRDLTKVSPVVTVVRDLKLRQDAPPTFRVNDPLQWRAAALKAAFENAQQKAALVAQQSGAVLGQVVTVSEGMSINNIPVDMMNQLDEIVREDKSVTFYALGNVTYAIR